MATSGARRRPQKYPVELRERAVRMVLDICGEAGRDEPGVIPRIAKQLGSGGDAAPHAHVLDDGMLATVQVPREDVTESPYVLHIVTGQRWVVTWRPDPIHYSMSIRNASRISAWSAA